MNREPLATSVVRTLFALHHWPAATSARARPGFDALAAMDFLLRFPSALEAAFELKRREMPHDARPSASETCALENWQLVAQLALWPYAHRLVVGSLVGRGLARLEPALGGDGLALSAKGTAAASTAAELGEWEQVEIRARAMGRRLKVGARALPVLAARAAQSTGGR